MNNNKISKIILIVLSIGLVISALVSVTYALFSNDIYAVNPDVYSTGLLSIEAKSKSENISLANALPITDEEGLASTPYIFTIKNVGNLDYKFDVKLLSAGDSASTFSPQYIKLQIDDGEVVTLYDLTNSEIKSDITLLAGESVDISLRVWLSIDLENDFYNTPNSELGKVFESKIVTDGQAIYTNNNN